MIWLLTCLVSAQLAFYNKGGNNMYIVKPRLTLEIPAHEFHDVFARDAVSVTMWGSEHTSWLPICTVNAENMCVCNVLDRDVKRETCVTRDGRRDLTGDCHVEFEGRCYLNSDLRPNLKDYEWKGLQVYINYPFPTEVDHDSTNRMILGGHEYYRICDVSSRGVCNCRVMNRAIGQITYCVSNSGDVLIDPALGRCHLAVKAFEDGSFVCFPINDPRPSKADLAVWSLRLPGKKYIAGKLVIPFSETKPDGIVMGFEKRPVEPESPLITSILRPIAKTGSIVEFRVPLSPFGKSHKHQLRVPNGLVPLASCTFEGAKLYLLIRNELKCTLEGDPEKAMFSSDACNISVDMDQLKARYEEIKGKSTHARADTICVFTLSQKPKLTDLDL